MFRSKLKIEVLRALAMLAATALLAGCDKSPPAAPATSAVVAPPPAAAPVPDVGKLDAVKVAAEGYGADASQAVAEAMRMAVLQVNGASLDASTVNARFGLDVAFGGDVAKLRAEGFAEQLRQRSGGTIRDFRIIEIDEPLLAQGRFKARIEASIARFEPPKELSKLKIVLAPIRVKSASVTVGNQSVASSEAGHLLRQRIAEALVQTGRFAVLDREFPPELQQELDLVAGGSAPGAEMAKLGQAASADLLWLGQIERLSYVRHAKALRTSDRELVSYSGGWAVNHRLVNVATRQVALAGRLAGQAPSTAPTTLGTNVNSQKVLDGMSQALVDGVVASIVGRLFPITVVSRNDQDVVLSQGGQVLKAGDRYAVVALGNELKDPQTGQSLGRTEAPCCSVVIDRVTPNLAYGRLDAVTPALDSLPPGALQLREPLPRLAGTVADAASGAPQTSKRVVRRGAPGEPADDAERPAAKTDDKW